MCSIFHHVDLVLKIVGLSLLPCQASKSGNSWFSASHAWTHDTTFTDSYAA